MPLAGDIILASDHPGPGDTDFVTTSETTNSGTYTDLATAGPAVTVDLVTGQQCLILIRATITTSNVGGAARMSYAVSGATVVAASDDDCLSGVTSATTQQLPGHSHALYTATDDGSHTFTAKYRQGSGLIGTFQNRRLTAIPLTP